jgi:prolipoprotein diacylglyceryl transferase
VPQFTWNVDPVLVNLGGFPLRWYSIIFLLAFIGGYALLDWQIRRGGGDEQDASDFIVYGVIAVLGGARLGHVLFYDLDKALANPLWVLKVWSGGLASHGAVIGLAIAMYLFTKRRRVSFIEGADRITFSGALGAALVRIGNFFNSEIVGRTTDQSWGVRFARYAPDPDHYRYPTQLFEAGIGLFVLGALFVFDRALGGEKRPRGALISFWFALYFGLRFLVEFYKEPQVFKGGVLDMGQYLSIPGALLGLAGLCWSFRKRVPAGFQEEYYEEDPEPPEGQPLA